MIADAQILARQDDVAGQIRPRRDDAMLAGRARAFLGEMEIGQPRARCAAARDRRQAKGRPSRIIRASSAGSRRPGASAAGEACGARPMSSITSLRVRKQR
jgi:hypothetical protein